ncbi:MAG: polysaccharide deacetylase family protein [Actinobacteria bacterium]|nr:MAG: polysaccharide deacetylase family protein [Actinomycetota bacterium]
MLYYALSMLKKIAPIAITIIIFAFLVFRFFIMIPVTVNGEHQVINSTMGICDALKAISKWPKRGNLLDIEGNLYKKYRGSQPTVYINGKKAGLKARVSRNDNITTLPGKDVKEPVAEKISEFGELIPTSSEYYNGSGALIMFEKAHPGKKLVRFGKYSKKTESEKVISQPAPDAVVRKDFKQKKVVALTFDDGPSQYTQQVLDILDKYDALATFFVLGENAKDNKDLLKAEKKAGHLIANHTYTHIYLNQVSDEKMRKELEDTNDIIKEATGKNATWLRPPGGNLDYGVSSKLTGGGFKIAMWNIDTNDWKKPAPSVITSEVLDNLHNGAVVLMHDGGGNRDNTVAALPEILQGIKDKGYKFVTLDELVKADY